MCGVAGVWRRRDRIGAADLSDVAAMADAILHRGPDDEGAWHDARLALGHRRLSIIDPTPAGRQPMVTPDGKGVIVYNGEIYNFLALRDELRAQGIVFSSDCDTEVLLLALHHWGPRKAVPLLDGMFAFAYYDLRGGELWLARDRLGIKPMSVADLGDRILFASEDKALLAAGVSSDVDAREITLRFAWQSRDASGSLFRAIERLAPGAIWKVDAEGIDRGRYWHVLDVIDPHRIVSDRGSDADRAGALEAMLGSSIGLHCRADAPLATACSGGVDSGLVTALSTRFRGDFHAYVVDPATGASEAPRAELTAARAGVPIRRVPLEKDRFLDLWPKMVWHLESDGWHASNMGFLAMTERCRADGVKVLLTGEGADELFGGYPWHMTRTQQWRNLSFPWRLLLGRRSYRERLRDASRSPLTARQFGRGERNRVLRSLAPEQTFLDARIFKRLEPVYPLAERAYLTACIYDLYTHLQDLLHRHDRLSMAASVELRVPFIENGMIDFALHLPFRFKYRRRTAKWLLKQVALRHIPRENVLTRKIGFALPGNLSAGAERLLAGGLLADAMRWPAAAVADMQELARQSPSSRLRMVGMELFLQLYSAGRTPEELAERLRATVSETR